MSSTESLQLNLGSLRSSMSLTLHTHHASRIWHGRSANEQQAAITGLNGFIGIMNKMKRGAEQDDPYSDWWMLRIEHKIADSKKVMQTLREQVDAAIATAPAALSLGENLNVQPVKLPLFVGSQLGFMAIYLLADYDELARRLILAHHTALIDRSTLERWLNEGGHALRSLFALSLKYRYSGTRRDDFIENNAAARAAVEKFGQLPQEVLDGTLRSRYAPPLARRDGQTQIALEQASPDDTLPASGDEPLPSASLEASETGEDAASDETQLSTSDKQEVDAAASDPS
jgi:integrating conjugative element protein (TIGR03761 family)